MLIPQVMADTTEHVQACLTTNAFDNLQSQI